MEQNSTEELRRLRQIAEHTLQQGGPAGLRDVLSEDTDQLVDDILPGTERLYRLLHELQVHQVELNVQHDELRQARQQFALLYEKYADLYDFAPVGYFSTTQDGHILEANLTGAGMLGVERGRLLEQTFAHFILPEDQDIYYFHRRLLAETQAPQRCELRLRGPDGRSFHARLQSIVVSPRGELPHYRTAVIDISDQVQAEAALRQSHDALEHQVQERTASLQRAMEGQRLLSDASSLLIASSEPDAWLPQIARLVAAHLGDAGAILLLKDKGRLELVAVAHHDAWREAEVRASVEADLAHLGEQHPAVQAVRQQQTIALCKELQLAIPMCAPGAGGEQREHTYLAVPLIAREHVLGVMNLWVDSPGRTYDRHDLHLAEELARRVAFSLDNAALQHAAQQVRIAAESAVRMRDQVFRLVSHDLKTPLSVILGYAGLLKRYSERVNLLDDEKFHRYIGHIETAVTQTLAQIEELLDVAAVQAGKPLPLNQESTDLGALLRRAVEACESISEHHQFCVDVRVSVCVMYGDGARLERALTNLLTNAVKYSPQGGEVHVTLADEARNGLAGVVLSVRDQGIGIPAADLPQLFEPFRRGGNVSRRMSGTGLGLVSTRQIVEQHGGTISVVSEEGVGSTFTVWLPRQGTNDGRRPTNDE